MMILFKPEHVAPILTGAKTQTRRLGKRRWRHDSIHQARTALFGEPFARLRILEVRQERLRTISLDDAVAEGYTGPGTFLHAFYRINGMAFDADPLVWVVTFEVVTQP